MEVDLFAAAGVSCSLANRIIWSLGLVVHLRINIIQELIGKWEKFIKRFSKSKGKEWPELRRSKMKEIGK